MGKFEIGISPDKTQLIRDIDQIKTSNNLIDLMYGFTHIFEQVPEKYLTDSLKDLRMKVGLMLTDIDFMCRLELFYKIYNSPDESRYLLDDKVTYSETYILDKDLFTKINVMKLNIMISLGKLKNNLLKIEERDYAF